MLVSTVVALILSSSAASAGPPPPEVTEGWYRYERQDLQGAIAIASRRLEADADDLAAHRLFVYATRQTREGQGLVPLYRTWFEAEPTVGSRFGLAFALGMVRAGEDRAVCDELEALLTELPDEPDVRYWSTRLRWDVARPCEWDGDALRQATIEAGAATEVGWSLSVVNRASEDLDEGLLADLRRVYEEDPSRLSSVGHLWRDGRRGKLVRQARQDALEAAQRALGGDDPRRIHYATSLLRSAGEQKLANEASARVQELDPFEVASRGTPWTDLQREVYQAGQKPTHEMALASLDGFAKKLPDEGRERMMWLHMRIPHLDGLGRDDEAFRARRELARLSDDPDDHNDFAYEAALRGEDLGEALTRIDAAVATLDDARWDPTSYGGWQAWAGSHRRTSSSWHDTRGWVLYRLGRLDEAAEALEEAALLHPGAVQHAHLGLVLHELGRDDEAFEHLVLAHTSEAIDEASLREDSLAALRQLWQARGVWHPGGLEGYLEAKRRPVESSDDESSEAHALVGEPFPIAEARRVDGGALDLAAIDGVLVVDLWATWCGPCVAGMPHLQQVADAYRDRGVTVVGLSVDKEMSAVKRFFKGAPTMAYDLAWIGTDGFKLANIDGIPSMFVIDADGNVATYISGYGGAGDTRLEDALDALLGG